MPPIVDQGEPMNANGIGASTAARISTRSRGFATPCRRNIGESEAPRRTSPRASGRLWTASGGFGI